MSVSNQKLVAFVLMMCGSCLAGWLTGAHGWRGILGLTIALVTGALYGIFTPRDDGSRYVG